jgi:hypothetical protein
MYTPRSEDNLRKYTKEYWLTEYVSNFYGVIVGSLDEPIFSCVLATCGGPTDPTDQSVLIHDDSLYLAIGDYVVRLGLPSLELIWTLKVDWSRCYGVYYSQKHECQVSHGELEICRISLNGEMNWRIGGKDIFTGELNMIEDQVLITDFNEEKYSIDIAKGDCTLLSG